MRTSATRIWCIFFGVSSTALATAISTLVGIAGDNRIAPVAAIMCGTMMIAHALAYRYGKSILFSVGALCLGLSLLPSIILMPTNPPTVGVFFLVAMIGGGVLFANKRYR